MTNQEIKELLSKKMAEGIQDKALEAVLRHIVFTMFENRSNNYDWDAVFYCMCKNMPELKLTKGGRKYDLR